MIGVKHTEYTVRNSVDGQAWKEEFLKTHDVVKIQENSQLIIITVSEIFNTDNERN